MRLARIEGGFDWHFHDGVDEAFFVLKGEMEMGLRENGVERIERLAEGDFLVVPRNVEHRPAAERECWIMMIETAGALNTGNVRNARTRDHPPRLSPDR